MAAAVIVPVPLLVLVFIFQKKIIEGLTAGAVKQQVWPIFISCRLVVYRVCIFYLKILV